MNQYGLSICFVLSSTIINTANATICQEGPKKTRHQGTAIALSSLSNNVSVCELKSEFNSSNFPRFFWLLHKGLNQPENSTDVLEVAITLANQTASSGKLGRAEKIYQIVLARYPSEPRVLSSNAALHIIRQNYKKAATMLDRAMEINPNDPLILNNVYLLAVLNGEHNRASQTNKQQLKTEPEHYLHIMRRALLDRLFSDAGDNKSWELFIQRIENEKNQQYWRNFNITLQSQGMLDLIQIANQWIDYKMPYEAILLLDYVLEKKALTKAHYIKAKAFEHSKHFKPALKAVNKARDIMLKSDNYDKSFYGSLLYEVIRLAYAANENEYSLRRLDEYVEKGYTHSHLDYMYAVNLDVLGRHDKAQPYFEVCTKQKLPDNMLSFCKKKQKEKIKPESISTPNKVKSSSITIKSDGINPLSYMKSGVGSTQVAWIGKTVRMDVKESERSVHVSWTAKYLQPEKPIVVIDGKDYKIKFVNSLEEQFFQVNLYLNAKDEDDAKSIAKQFNKKEKYILVKGKAIDIRPFNKTLSAVVAMEHAIFTSDIIEIK